MIIFIYGSDSYRSRQKLNDLKEKFRREVDPDGRSITVIDGSNTTVEKITEASRGSSLFTRKAMVIVENIFSNKSPVLIDKVCGYLKTINPVKKNSKQPAVNKETDNIILFWDETSGEKMGRNKLFNYLSKLPFVQIFKTLSNTESTAWVKKAVEKRGGKISQQTAMRLTSLFGSNLWQLSNEINKIINYKQGLNRELISGAGGAVIEAGDIDILSRGQADENIFALTDAISRKNTALALKLFEQEIEAGMAEPYLLTMIVRQFRILLQVRQALDMGLTSRKIINELKLHPFVVQKSITQAGNFNLLALKKIFVGLVDIDRKIKTGKADLKTELELFIAKL